MTFCAKSILITDTLDHDIEDKYLEHLDKIEQRLVRLVNRGKKDKKDKKTPKRKFEQVGRERDK